MSSPKQAKAAAFMRKAIQYFEAGDLAKAQKNVSKYLSIDPGNADANHLSGLIANQSNKPDVAITLISRALQANPRIAMAHNNLGEAYRSKEQFAEAEACYRQAIALEPRVGGFHNNLGIVLQAQERVEDALAAYEKAHGIAPNDPMTLTNLANLLCDIGELQRSIKLHKRTVTVAPTFAEAHANYGIALQRIGEIDAALSSYREAIRLNPRHANALRNLASLLEKRGEISEAVAIYRRSIEVDPDYVDGYHALAELLRFTGKPDEAIAVYEVLGRSDPSRLGVMMNIGSVHRAAGNQSEAEACFRAILEIDPTYVRAQNALAQVTKRKDVDDPEIQALRTLAARSGLDAAERVPLEFALGKSLEDAGADDEVMEHIIAANRLKRETVSYDQAQFDTEVDQLKIVCDAAFFSSHSNIGVRDATPIFIVGMPRSGTSLLEQIASSHSRVVGAGELNEFHFVSQQLKAQASFAGETYPACIRDFDAERFSTIGESYVRAVRNRYGDAERITDKLPHNFLNVGLIRTALPDAKIIHCRRHPVDTCLSIYKHNFADEHSYAYDQVELAQHYLAYERLMAHWREVLPGVMHEVRYEDVVADVEMQARALIKFCDLPWEDACLEFYKTKRLVNTISASQVREPIYNRSVAAWKRYEKDLAPLIEALGESIEAYENRSN